MNLQTALIALGVLLVAGIYLFSRWQEGRGGKSEGRAKRDRTNLSEPSLGRDEPSFDQELVQDLDADLSVAESPVTEDSPPPDWDALEKEMVQPVVSDQPEHAVVADLDDAGPESSASAGESVAAESVEPVELAEVAELVVTTGTDTGGSIDTSDESLETKQSEEVPASTVEDEIPVLELRVDDSDEEAVMPSSDDIEATAESPEPDTELPVLEDPVMALDEDQVATPDEAVAEGDVYDDADEDMRDARPSLGSFLGSLKPINKLRHSLQNRLDAVKAEREESTVASDPEVEHDQMKQKQESTGQVDLLDMTAAEPIIDSVDSNSAGDEPSESAPQVSDQSNANESVSDAAESKTAPVLSAPGREHDLQPAPGFDKLSQIDYYVKLSGERDVSRDSVLAVYREAAAGLSKSHSVYGLRLPDKVWRDLEHEPEESRFGDLVITVQLADNKGPVSEQEMTRFSNLVVKLSESTGRGFSFMAPIEHAHQQALAIDSLRRKFDSIFVVNIKPTEDEFFDGAMIDRCASQIGLTPDDNRFYARYKPVGKQKVCLYSMANMTDNGEFEIGNMRGTRTRGVTFFTRPAVNRSPGAVFSEMVDAAKAFASRVKGEPIAPGYDDLSNDDIEAIRRSIEKVAKEMESYGIVPGSEEASRLF